MSMKRQRTADDVKALQKRVRRSAGVRESSRILANAGTDLLMKACELLDKVPVQWRRLAKVATNSPERNANADECANSLEKHASDEKRAREEEEGDCSDKTEKHASDERHTSEEVKDDSSEETSLNFDLRKDIWEIMMRGSVRLNRVSLDFLAGVGAPGDDFGSIEHMKQLVHGVELRMGVEFRLLKADLDPYSDDAA